MRLAHTTVTRMEQAKVTLRWTTVKAMLELYGVDASAAEEFLTRTDRANAPGWWLEYRDVLSPPAAQHISLESSATRIRCYEPATVPALLQTERYARGVLRLNRPSPTNASLKRHAAVRTRRQALLNHPGPAHLWAILDETALRRPVGGADVLRDQIEYLIEATYRPNVTLQVLAFASGLHPGALGPFTLFRFPLSDLPDGVWTDSVGGSTYSEDLAAVALHREVLDRMSAQALSPVGTREFLDNVLKQLGR